MTAIATLVTCLGILTLLLANRDPKMRTSPALWLVVIWVAIATSRPVSVWLQIAPERSVDQYLEGTPLDRNVFTVLLVMGLIVLSGRSRKVLPLLQSNLPLFLFFSYCAVSIFWSDFPEVSFKRWIKAIGDVVMILLVLTEHDPSAAIKRLFTLIAFAFAPLSLLFIRYYSDLGRQYNRWDGTVTYSGITSDKNMLGMACLIFGLALVWRLLEEFAAAGSRWRNRSIFAHGLVLAMLVWLLVLSNSKTALGCLVLASGLMIAVSFPNLARKRAHIHLMVAAIVAVVLLTLFADVGGLLLELLGRNLTLTGRTELWSMLIELMGNPLVGTGFESFWLGRRLQKIWGELWWRPNQAHNGYLEIYLTLGWIGVGLLALVAIKGYQNILKVSRYDPDGAKLRLAFFVVAIVYNLTEAAFKTTHPVWQAFLLAVIVVPKPNLKRERPIARRGVISHRRGGEILHRREPLGPFVQIDEALVGGKGGPNKELVLVATEARTN